MGKASSNTSETETRNSSTGADFFHAGSGAIKSNMSDATQVSSPDKEILKEIEKGTVSYSPTPEEIAKEKYYNEQANTEKSRQSFLKRMKLMGTITGGILSLCIAGLASYWAYNLSSISEPIGEIKKANEFLEKRDEELLEKIQRNEDRMNSIIDRIYGQSSQNQHSNK